MGEVQILHQQIAERLAIERQTAGDALEDDDAERPQIGAMVDAAQPAGLLGRHEERRAEQSAGLGARRDTDRARRGLDLRNAEVEHLGHVFVVIGAAHEKDVLGLQVAVNDAALVGAGKRARDLAHDARGFVEREGAKVLDSGVERFADEQLHDDVGAAVGGDPVVVDLDGVLRLNRRRGAGLGVENGCRASWLLAYSRSMNLMATGVPSELWRPSYTEPMPPRPMSPRSSYFPPMRVLGGGLLMASLDIIPMPSKCRPQNP